MTDDALAFPPTEPAGDDELLADLTEPQRAAVTTTHGPVLVLAGAGSGKTRVITRRAAYLAATVTRPWHVLAITFTNKAASEMKERIELLGSGQDMTVCTFHSLCVRILRMYHEQAGVAPNFTIVDQADRRKVVKEAIERAQLNTTNFRPALVESRISRAKNDMESPADFAARAFDFISRTIAQVYEIYEDILSGADLLDFDDLLLRTARLLEQNDEVRHKLSDRYRYLLIDEYQDTNIAQYRIARLLAEDHRNIFVTGDPDQSIYGWRGADIRNILRFEEDYPDARVIRLEQNYRSTKRILSAADAVISANMARKEKTLWTENAEGVAIRVIACEDNEAEAKTIVSDIAQQIDAGRPRGDFAIFYRVNAMSRAFEEAFLTAGVPYCIARGLAFYERKEVKDVLAYLRVAVNPADEVSLERIINTPTRGIGKTTVDKLKKFADSSGCTLYEAVHRAEEVGLSARTLSRLKTFTELLDTLHASAESNARTAVEQALSLSGLQAQLNELAEANSEPLQNVNELVSAASTFDRDNPEGTLLDWLSYTSLLGDIDVFEGDAGAVTLMTLHAAKGLEFPVVYIVGAESGLIPFSRAGDDVEDEEEERRLFFVGMTRAMERLTVTHARWRMMRGTSSRTERSIFLDELPKDEIEWVGGPAPRRRGGGKPAGELPPDIELWEVGSLVRHPTYGLGRVTSLLAGKRRTHVSVEFEEGGDYTWVLEFADLQRVEYDEIG